MSKIFKKLTIMLLSIAFVGSLSSCQILKEVGILKDASSSNEVVVKEKHLVKFNTDGGSKIAAKRVQEGEKVNKPRDPSKDGYNFIGWFVDEDLEIEFDFNVEVIMEDTTIYAGWEAITSYTVTFESNGGTSVPSQSVAEGQKATKPEDPTRDYYIFNGWYKEETLATAYDFQTEIITSDTTIYADWIATYVVTFETNGGAEIEAQTIVSGEKAEKPEDPTKEDANFIGWFKDENCTQAFDFETEVITANTTIYVGWHEIYTVTFESNGGTSVEAQKVLDGRKN